MAVEITVVLDGSPGGMARVIAALKRFGLAFSSHHIEAIDDQRSRLTISAEGRAVAEELRDQIGEIKGVAEVVDVDASDGRTSSAAPVRAVGGVNELAGQIVADYPRILRYVDAFEETISNARERSQQLRLLGRQVGGKLGADDAMLHEAQTLHEALEKGVVPILDQIAEPEVVGSDIRVRLSIFTRRQVNTMDLVFGGEASRCDFLSGMIEGMIAGVESLPNVQVEEASCRTNGDEYCLFRITT